MCCNRFIVRIPALFAGAAALSCADIVETHPTSVQPHIRIQTSGLDLDLAGREITLGAGDSLLLVAVVEHRPEAYDVPEIKAADPSMLERVGDGIYNVRRTGTLDVTATAFAKSPTEQPRFLMESARINAACTLEMRAGILLTVRDSITGTIVMSDKTRRIRATSASRTDSAVVSPSGTPTFSGVVPAGDGRWALAMENAGSWTVQMEADGYRLWRQDGIVVTRGLCHVKTLNVTARLQPL